MRVGLVAASARQPRALVEAFAALAGSPYAELVVLAVGDGAEPRLPWLWRLSRRADGWVFGGRKRAGEPVDLPAELVCEHILPLPGRAAGASPVVAWRNEIAAHRLDVVFALGDIDDELLAGIARDGVWHFDFGGCQAGFAGFGEVAEGRAISTVSLQVRQSAEPDKLLYQSWTRTLPFSASRNRDKLLRRAAQLPARVLTDLHRSDGAARTVAPFQPQLRLIRTPPVASSRQALRGLGMVGRKIAERALQKLLCIDQWLIAYRFGGGQQGAPELGQFSCLVPPKDRFWADPFPWVHDGRHFIFFEELVFSAGKAHISVVEIDRDGRCSAPQQVLERPYHLSYPFLLESCGQLFMVPETGLNGTVELYRCERFPDRWHLEKVLLRVPCCADATFHQAGGKWWMFVNIGRDDSDVHDDLFLYYADRLDGEWTPHPANPVKSDVRSARPAGRLYQQDGQLYRPAQIGAPIYGAGISLNRVLKLTPEEYREQEVGCIVAPPGGAILGVHTLNRAGDLNVVDGFIRRRRLGGRTPQRFSPFLLTTREASHVHP